MGLADLVNFGSQFRNTLLGENGAITTSTWAGGMFMMLLPYIYKLNIQNITLCGNDTRVGGGVNQNKQIQKHQQ